MRWVFPLSRESKHIFAHLTTFVDEVLPSVNIRLRRFHSDGGSELVETEVLGFLHKSDVTTSHSPRNTPQMNSVVDPFPQVRCCVPSSLPLAFWWLALDCAVYLLNRLPTKAMLGYMSPSECVNGAAPNLKWLRICAIL